jgi:hypothetical protein
MADRDVVVVNGGSKAGWFVAGGLIAAAILAAILYLNGTFDNSRTIDIQIEVPKVTIPATD